MAKLRCTEYEGFDTKYVDNLFCVLSILYPIQLFVNFRFLRSTLIEGRTRTWTFQDLRKCAMHMYTQQCISPFVKCIWFKGSHGNGRFRNSWCSHYILLFRAFFNFAVVNTLGMPCHTGILIYLNVNDSSLVTSKRPQIRRKGEGKKIA